MMVLWLLGCTSMEEPAETDPCEGPGARSTCLSPTQTPEYYAEQSSRYFDTMDYSTDVPAPPYSELVARWEWPPWLLLTAFGAENIEATDTLLLLYPSIVPERDCRFFDEQPFGRCRVVFYYDDESHQGRGCPIYEEFTFNDAGEVTFIEAWSDLPGFLPMPEGDTWAEGTDVDRLSTRVPGLGTAEGLIDLDGPEMSAAAAEDEVVADFVYRANDWYTTWLEAVADSENMWEIGCGWEVPGE